MLEFRSLGSEVASFILSKLPPAPHMSLIELAKSIRAYNRIQVRNGRTTGLIQGFSGALAFFNRKVCFTEFPLSLPLSLSFSLPPD